MTEGGGAEHGKNKTACFSHKQNCCRYFTRAYALYNHTHTQSMSSCKASAAVLCLRKGKSESERARATGIEKQKMDKHSSVSLVVPQRAPLCGTTSKSGTP